MERVKQIDRIKDRRNDVEIRNSEAPRQPIYYTGGENIDSKFRGAFRSLSIEEQAAVQLDSVNKSLGRVERDRAEAQNAIAHFGIDPVEVLHFVERWSHTILSEFLSLKARFKIILKEKWEKEQLGRNTQSNNRTRQIFQKIGELEKMKREYFSKEYFEGLHEFLSNVTYETDSKELKGKISNLIEVYSKVVGFLEFFEQQKVDGITSFENLRTVLEKLSKLNEKTLYTICIIGLEKCGKSTFINALLGFNLVPSAAERCTQIRTVLKPVRRENPSVFALAQFYEDEQFSNMFKQMVKKSDETEQDFQARKSLVEDIRQEIKRKFPTGEEILYLDPGEQQNGRKRDEIVSKLHKYIVDEVYVNIIRQIEIFTDKIPGKNFELLDVPGFDSPIREHRDAGLQAISSADAFLFLTDGGRPSLTRDQIRLLDEIQDRKRNLDAMKRAFGIITKLDYFHSVEQFNEHLTKSRQELIEKSFDEDRIFAVCSILELLDRNSEQRRTISNKIRNFENLEVGFENCKRSLNHYIEFELPKANLRQVIEIGQNRIARYVVEALENAKKLIPIDFNLIDEKSFEDLIRRENDEIWDLMFDKEIFQPVFDKANIWLKSVIQNRRAAFLNEVKTRFYENFVQLAKSFTEEKYDIQTLVMKQYGYTSLHSSVLVIEDKLREKLSFHLEDIVLQASNNLSRFFYDDFVLKLEDNLNKIAFNENDEVFRTKLITLDVCRYELRAFILGVCRPLIMATLRYSSADQNCRRNAINEFLLVAPVSALRLCYNPSTFMINSASTEFHPAPELKNQIETVLGISQLTSDDGHVPDEALKVIFDKLIGLKH